MKPETHEYWNKALSLIKNAEKLYKDKKNDEAEEQALLALIKGISAMIKLSRELGIDDLSTIAWNALQEHFDRTKKGHYTPKETIEWVRKVLKRLSDELTPYGFKPFE